ncbi:hypothetical protein [Thermomonospora echinospora]|nr:hypothetical protein [Thermomonospora echinospora]
MLKLAQDDKLNEITGLGPRRISEIEAALVFAGLPYRHTDPP